MIIACGKKIQMEKKQALEYHMQLVHTKPKFLTCLELRTRNRRKSSSRHLKGPFYWWMKKWNLAQLKFVSRRVLTPSERRYQVTLQERIWHSHFVVRIRDKVVDRVTSLLATGPRNFRSITWRSKRFFLSSIRQAWLRSPHSSLFSEKGGRFLEGEVLMAWS